MSKAIGKVQLMKPGSKFSIANAEHFTWGDKCDGWWLLKSPNFTVIEERMPPGKMEKRHYHTQTEQFFYCLEGELLIENGDKAITLKSRESLYISAGTIHKVKNIGTEPVQFLIVSLPDAHDDRIDLE
jgi:mannose-6-phosphate isomerase-like protein (cupin superfamily)